MPHKCTVFAAVFVPFACSTSPTFLCRAVCAESHGKCCFLTVQLRVFLSVCYTLNRVTDTGGVYQEMVQTHKYLVPNT